MSRPACDSWANQIRRSDWKLAGIAMRALRKATNLLGLAIGKRLAELRDSDFIHNRLGARIEEQRLRIRVLTEANSILAARWGKIPDRRRPHYTPELRFRILRFAERAEENGGLDGCCLEPDQVVDRLESERR
jgi:hypothetical protein